ncbi:acyltransferase family protein [Enterobacter kobei]|uniref:acyltransferase family protein n=1 Tax=Enterobacter kobei TaxID=208224 RepID=UPI002005A550|nr:acyltransferase [Enterobacter kobei]MCK7029279.1 acyltransferase [Enterobacter kobei]
MNNKIQSIHLLRGIAGISVVLYHFKGYLNGVYAQKDLGQILFGSGAFGVDIFFMISGFIIALSTQNITSKAIFATRRFFRIYPAFIVVFVIGVITVYQFDPSENLLRGLFFIHRDYSLESPGFGYYVLGPAWTLTYEIYFYALFAVAMAFSHKYRTILTSIFLVTPVFILQVYFNGTISINGNAAANIPSDYYTYGLLRFISSPMLIEFVVGMLFYELYRNININVSRGIAKFVLMVSTGIFITNYLSGHFTGFGMDKAGVISAILLFGFLFYDKFVGFGESKLLGYLADISFSIYISHYLFINPANYYKPEFIITTNGLGRLSMMLTITLAAGTMLHFYVERPFISIGKTIEKNIFSYKKKKQIA